MGSLSIHNSSHPLPRGYALVYSSVSTCIIALQTSIDTVFSMFNRSEIGSSIIKFIAVNMICEEPIGSVVNYTVHPLKSPLFPATTSVSYCVAQMITPFKFTKSFVIRIVNDCLFILGKLDELHSFVLYHITLNNTLLVSTNPILISRFKVQLGLEHRVALTQGGKLV